MRGTIVCKQINRQYIKIKQKKTAHITKEVLNRIIDRCDLPADDADYSFKITDINSVYADRFCLRLACGMMRNTRPVWNDGIRLGIMRVFSHIKCPDLDICCGESVACSHELFLHDLIIYKT